MSSGGPTVFTTVPSSGTTFNYTDWATPSVVSGFTNLGTVANITSKTMRMGSNLFMRLTGQCGTVAGQAIAMSLPDSLAIDFTKINGSATNRNWLGEGQRIQPSAAASTTTGTDRFIIFTDHSNANWLFWGARTGSDTIEKSVGTQIFGNSNWFTLNLMVPISGWS